DAVSLFSGLQGTPQGGGAWTDLDGTGQLNNGVLDATGLAPGLYAFLYTVPGTVPCPADTATVFVTVTAELDAGEDADVTLCTSEFVSLLQFLDGTPQPGGTWTGLESQAGLIDGALYAGIAGVGVHHYRYVHAGSTNCAPDSALLTVTIQNGPRAGNGVPRTVCSDLASLDLFTQLSPPYDDNGTWHYPDGSAMASSDLDPGTDPPGTYTYVVPAIGNCPADTATVEVTIIPEVNAGTNGSLSFCSNGASALLSTGLGGTPDTTGSWTYNNVPHGPVYNPQTDVPGNYVYRVNGTSPCPHAVATVLVTEVLAPIAGADNSYTFCASDGSFNMFNHLAGNPQSGGTWMQDGTPPTSHGPSYVPTVDSSAVFLYILPGVAPCNSDTARLTMTEVPAPQAGSDALLAVCPTDTLVDLFAALGPTADSLGTWTDGNNMPVPGGLIDAILMTIGTHEYTYTVIGTPPCGDATATVTVDVGAGLNAGIGGNDTIC